MSRYVDDVEGTIKLLADNEMIVISESGELIGAYPFTMEDRPFKIKVKGLELNAMCAIDALAINMM